MSQLSPGKWHEKVPREYFANLEFRLNLLRLCRNDRQAQRAVWYACANDFLFFVNVFVYQFNPLVKGERSVGPFITWNFQEQVFFREPPVGKGILWCYEHNRTAVVEKSRDMGASWLFLIFQVWLAMFHPHVQSFNISRSADAVESNSRNSLFTKIRFIHKHIPVWLKGKVNDQKFLFEYGKTGSEITGEASTGRAGTGGRASVIFVDEFPEIKEAEKVRQNTASIADCRFFNGTHLGVGTEFYNMTEQAKTGEIIKIQMHWTRHPRKNQQMYSWEPEMGRPRYWWYDEVLDELYETKTPTVPFPEDYPFERTDAPAGGPHPGIRSVWYDKKAKEIGNTRQVAMELDINPTGSSSQFYEPLTIRRLRMATRPPVWTGDIHVDPNTCQPSHLFADVKNPLLLWITPGLDKYGKLNHVTPSNYVIGCDVATGSGATPTCLSIFDCKRGQKVGSYASIWKDAKEMAWIAVGLCRLFKSPGGDSAKLAWECPGAGITFGTEVMSEIGFRNVYWKTDVSKVNARPSDTPGWYSNPNSRRALHEQYRAALENNEFVNFDDLALEETLSYVYAAGSIEHPRARKNSDPAAEGVNHGDRVVSDALAWLLAKEFAGRVVEEEVVVTYAVPNSIQGRREYNEQIARRKSHGWD